MERVKYKAVYRNCLHDIITIHFPDMHITVLSKTQPYVQEIKPDRLIQFVCMSNTNTEVYEGDFDNDGNCVIWCDRCNAWQFCALDVPTRDVYIPCHACDGDFFFADHINEFKPIGNRFVV